MTQPRGRPPKGAEHAQSVDGSPQARQRLSLILRTVSGEMTVAQACAELSVSEAHFHRLRDRALHGAAEALEPRSAGRPRSEPDAIDPQQVAELQDQVRELELQIMAAHLREEIALVMPQVLQRTPATARKKNERRSRRRSTTAR